MASELTDREVPLNTKIDELYTLIDSIDIAMFTTRRFDGTLVTRPMATQKRKDFADLWFVADVESEKIDELRGDPNVSLAYYNAKSYEWVSVSGTVRISQDRDLIRRLYQPDWKMWFGDDGGARDGGPNDPRFALLLVDARSAVYGKRNKPKPLVLFELMKGLVTGSQPDVADVRHVSRDELLR